MNKNPTQSSYPAVHRCAHILEVLGRSDTDLHYNTKTADIGLLGGEGFLSNPLPSLNGLLVHLSSCCWGYQGKKGEIMVGKSGLETPIRESRTRWLVSHGSTLQQCLRWITPSSTEDTRIL